MIRSSASDNKCSDNLPGTTSIRNKVEYEYNQGGRGSSESKSFKVGPGFDPFFVLFELSADFWVYLLIIGRRDKLVLAKRVKA